MDLRRLRAGEWIVAVSGIVLVISLFLPWYETSAQAVSGGRPGRVVQITAWEAFSVIDVLLLMLGVLAIGLLIVTAIQPTAAVGIASDALLTIAAGVVAIIAVIRVLDVPGGLEGTDGLATQTGRAVFAWVGLAAVLGVLAGAIIAMRDERLSGPSGHTDATGVPVVEPPPIETFSAPPRQG